MAYAFRSASSTATGGTTNNASGGILTITAPSGTADGDLLVAVCYLESDTNTWSSVPSGWNVGPTQANTGAFKIHTFWKIAASEGASWSWTPTSSAWRSIVIAAYTGATGSGTGRVDQSAGNQGDAQLPVNQTAPSVTPTANNELVIFAYGNYGGTNVTTLSGACTSLRVSYGGTTISDLIQTTAGATGTTCPVDGPGTQDFAALHLSFFLDLAAPSYTPTPSAGSLSLSGVAATLDVQTPVLNMGYVIVRG